LLFRRKGIARIANDEICVLTDHIEHKRNINPEEVKERLSEIEKKLLSMDIDNKERTTLLDERDLFSYKPCLG